MTIVDLTSEARGALSEALDNAAPVGWPVFDTLPENVQPPYLYLGVIEASDESQGAEQFEKLSAELIGVYRGGDRGELGAAMFAGRLALDRKAFITDVAQFRQCRFVSGSISDASKEDGITYAALSRFELFGEPLDG